MTLGRHICLAVLLASGCFGEYAPGDTEQPTSSSSLEVSTAQPGTSTTDDGESNSTGVEPVCEHLDILVITNVSVSMAPFADGISNVLLALGASIEETFGRVSSYNLALTYAAPPEVNADAFELPPGGGGCTQLGALVRGIDECAQAFEGRPYLRETDDLGAGLTCITGGLLSGQWSPIYETPRPLDALVALLEGEDDPALASCNAGFHASPDPLLVILLVDDEDEGQSTVLQTVASAVATQGTSLENIGLFVVGADAATCPSTEANACGARPSCRIQEFAERGFTNVGLSDNVRRFNLCRVQETDSAAVADDFLEQMAQVVGSLCT